MALPCYPNLIQRILYYAMGQHISAEIDLSNSGLAEIPKKLAKSSKLQKLLVNNNDLSVIPEFAASLKILNISDNRVSSLPFLPATLLELNAARNRLFFGGLPGTIASLVALESLDLSSNQLEFVCLT